MYDDGKSDPYDDPDGTGRAQSGPPPLTEAFKNGGKPKPVVPAKPPGLCDPWYIRVTSVVVIFFVLAATAHGWLRSVAECSPALVFSVQLTLACLMHQMVSTGY